MGQQIEAFAVHIASTTWTDIPDAVRTRAKLLLLDCLGVMLAGSLRPEVAALRDRLVMPGAGGATVLSPMMDGTDPRTAALLNGLSGRSIELCDGILGVQPSVQILPALLAIGETATWSGEDLLTALVLGYEVAGRFAAGFTPRAFAHGNGQIALLAAVAATARLHGFNAADLSLAMRIATTMLMTPSYLSTAAGATALNVPAGMSAVAALLAPDLALSGYSARDDAIEEALGQMVGNGFDPSRLTQDFGATWQMPEGYFRFYACCNPIHPALDCLRDILDRIGPEAGAIDRIDAETHAFASVMRNQTPPNYFASKYSFPHAAAVLVMRGGLGFAEIDDSALTDPAIAELRQRVLLTEDPTMSARAPALRQARVTVTLTNGRQETAMRDMSRRDREQPDPSEDVRTKFAQLAGTVLTADGVAAIAHLVDHPETASFSGALIGLMRQHLRQTS